MNLQTERRRILWTGGFDSTYLVVDALLRGHRVEAMTWRGPGMESGTWQKVENEDEARRRITRALPADLAGRLGQVEVREKYRVVQPKMAEVYGELLDAVPLGETFARQNWVLGAVPSVVGESLEGAFVKGDHASEPWLREVLERHGIVYALADRSKDEVLADAQRRGFEHLLRLTWSCEDPLGKSTLSRREPCGICAPCKARIINATGRA